MPRVKRGVGHVKRRHGVLKKTKGFQGGRKSLIAVAQTALMKAGAHAYVGRKVKKRTIRQKWTIKINAAVRPSALSYSKFINALKKNEITLNRKMLSEIADEYPEVFKKIVETTKQ